MGSTLVVECSRCGGLLLTPAAQKTKTCPYCGTRVKVMKAKKLASARTANQASQILRHLKTRKGLSGHQP